MDVRGRSAAKLSPWRHRGFTAGLNYTRQSEQEVSQQCKAIEKMCSRLPKERNRLKTLIRILEAEFSSLKARLT
jgi:hypothetical protein